MRRRNPDGRPADERLAARQRRPADPATWTLPRLPRLRRRRRRAGGRARRVDPARSASCCATSTDANPDDFRLFCPDETNSNRLGAVFEVSDRAFAEPVRRPTTSRSRATDA
ncbi:MAG: hypothetical protein WKF82_10355 [Nocardioidaceae bacterium]